MQQSTGFVVDVVGPLARMLWYHWPDVVRSFWQCSCSDTKTKTQSGASLVPPLFRETKCT